MVSSFGTLYTGVLAGARVMYALARGGLLPAGLGRVAPTTHIPRNAVLVFGAWAIVLAVSGTYEILTDLSVFATLLFLGLTVGAVFVLRRTHPDAERPVRAWGYPIVPALYLLGVGALLINTLLAMPGRALAGLGLIALGLPVYAYYDGPHRE
jgi:APA family basic amino acid/polyamine antiporter